jgi:uncharacterized protein (DUF433 family)
MSKIITKDPEVLSGVPVFVGTRVPVQNLLDYIKSGLSINDFLDDFPGVEKNTVLALLDQLDLDVDDNKEAA